MVPTTHSLPVMNARCSLESNTINGIPPEKTVPRARTHPEPMMGKCFHPPSTKRVIPPPPIGDEKIFTDAPNPDAGHKE